MKHSGIIPTFGTLDKGTDMESDNSEVTHWMNLILGNIVRNAEMRIVYCQSGIKYSKLLVLCS